MYNKLDDSNKTKALFHVLFTEKNFRRVQQKNGKPAKTSEILDVSIRFSKLFSVFSSKQGQQDTDCLDSIHFDELEVYPSKTLQS